MDVLKRHLETHKNPKFLVSRLVHSTFLNLLTILLVSPVTTAKKFSEVKRSWKSTKPKHIRQRATVVQSVVKILQRPMLSEFTAVQQRLRVSWNAVKRLKSLGKGMLSSLFTVDKLSIEFFVGKHEKTDFWSANQQKEDNFRRSNSRGWRSWSYYWWNCNITSKRSPKVFWYPKFRSWNERVRRGFRRVRGPLTVRSL